MTSPSDRIAIEARAESLIDKTVSRKRPHAEISQGAFHNFPLEKTKPLSLDRVHYVLSNEKGQTKLFSELAPVSTRSNGIHLGFACWLNFDLIALRKPQFAILCDIDTDMIALLDLIKETVKTSSTQDEFIEAFWQKLSKTNNFSGLLGKKEILNKERFREKMQSKGWLSSQENFLTVKQMYFDGKIIHRVLNVTDTSGKFTQIQSWARENQLAFDTIYLSNIVEWVKGNQTPMNQNIDKLMDAQTCVISAWKENPLTGSPLLHFEQGNIPEVKYAAKKKLTVRKEEDSTPRSVRKALFS